MIKNPIQEVTNKLQYRAIGIVNGVYKPNDVDQLNRGTITDKEGKIVDTVILGKALSLIKKYMTLLFQVLFMMMTTMGYLMYTHYQKEIYSLI